MNVDEPVGARREGGDLDGEVPGGWGLSALLADYAQRCEDHRRQVSYFPKLIVAIIGIMSTSLAWVLDSETPDRTAWVLPIAVVLCEVVACFGVYVYWSSGIMRRYLTDIELHLMQKLPPDLRIHSIDQHSDAEIGLGFHYWSGVNPLLRRRRAIRHTSGALVGLMFVVVLGAMWAWGQSSEVYASSNALSTLVKWAGLGLPVLWLGLYLWARLVVLAQLKPGATPGAPNLSAPAGAADQAESSLVSDDEATEVLVFDFNERNADYRALIDNYPLFLTLVITILAGAVSLLLRGEYKWVYVFAPFLFVTIPYFLLQTYRQGKALRRYLVSLEAALDTRVSRSGPGVHRSQARWSPRNLARWRRGQDGRSVTAFHIGFFRVVRERLWQRTTGSRILAVNAGVALAAVAVYLLLLVWMMQESYHWIVLKHAPLVKYYPFGVAAIVLLLLADLILYLEAGNVAN